MFTVDTSAVTQAVRGLERFGDDVRRHCIVKLAETVKKRTVERVATTKQGPDGDRWRSWSDNYAETRTSRHSLLVSTGLLRRTISVRSTSDGIRVGSPRTYAAAVQAKRPFLGLGTADIKPLERVLGSWATQEMQRLGHRR
jgi:phage gpG-like protein